MYRNEMKYVIDRPTALMMAKRMEKLCKFDENAGPDGAYQVTSLYFDDFGNSALNDNLIGQIARKKYRIRAYNHDDGYIRFEKKVKHNRGGKKESVVLTKEEYRKILRGEVESFRTSESPLLREFYIDFTSRHLRPKVIVEYDRQSFVYDYGQVRVTFDKGIRYERTHLDLFEEKAVYLPAIQPEYVVLEVKFTGFLPGVIKAMIQEAGLVQQSVSKYSICRTRNQ